MKVIKFQILFIIIIITNCENVEKKGEPSPILNEFCSVIPEGWECEIITSDYNNNDIPRNAPSPVAIIKYFNPNVECTIHLNYKFNPSLILDFYPIDEKQSLIGLIRSQELYSWCIPVYFGETKNHFIISSPCFMNSGECLNDLYEAINTIITVNDYKF